MNGRTNCVNSGGGQPVNSTVVQEYAGENIPANYFVSKVQGSKDVFYDADNNVPDFYYWVNENLLIYKKGDYFYSKLNGTRVSSLKIEGDLNATDIMLLKNKNKIVFTNRAVTGTNVSIISLYLNVVTCQEDGTLEYYEQEIQTEQFAAGGYRRSFVRGYYNENFIYAVSYNAVSAGGAIEKWVVNDTITRVNYTTNNAYGNFSIVAYLGCVDGLLLTSSSAASDFKSACLYPDSGSFRWKSDDNWVSTFGFTGYLFKGSVILVDDFHWRAYYASPTISTIYKANLKTGECKKITTDITSSNQSQGIMLNPYDSNSILTVINTKFGTVNLNTGVSNIIYDMGKINYSSSAFPNSTDMTFTLNCSSAIVTTNGRIRWCSNYRYYTSNMGMFVKDLSLPHVELPTDDNPSLYGITKEPMNRHFKGTLIAASKS